jgi:hypothetical protein
MTIDLRTLSAHNGIGTSLPLTYYYDGPCEVKFIYSCKKQDIKVVTTPA